MSYREAVLADRPNGYWPLGDPGDTFADLSGHGYNGASEAGGPLRRNTSLGQLGQAAQGTGVRWSRIILPPGSAFPVGTSSNPDFSVELWMRATESSSLVYLFAQRDGSDGGYNGEWMVQMQAGSVIFVTYNGNNGGAEFNLSSTRRLDDNRLHHIAAVRRNNSGFLYVDGSLHASAAGIGLDFYGWSVGVFADARDGLATTATIGHAAFYHHGLSPSQITRHWRSGITGATPHRRRLR